RRSGVIGGRYVRFGVDQQRDGRLRAGCDVLLDSDLRRQAGVAYDLARRVQPDRTIARIQSGTDSALERLLLRVTGRVPLVPERGLYREAPLERRAARLGDGLAVRCSLPVAGRGVGRRQCDRGA